MPVAEPRGHGVSHCPNGQQAPALLDRWDVLSLVTALRRPLGLSDRDILVLRAHLSVLPHGPLRINGLNVSFMNLSEIQERACGMDERRFRRGEVRLEEIGLIRRNLSANGRRFPERDASGTIVHAYGIDLSPLLARVVELEALRADLAEAEQKKRRLRNALSARVSALVRAFGPDLPERIITLRDSLRTVLRRKAICATELGALERQLSAEEAALQPPQQEPTPASVSDRTAPDDGQTVRHIDPELKDKKERHLIAKAWLASTTLKQFYDRPPEDCRTAWKILSEFASFLTVPRQMVDRLIQLLGWQEAIFQLDRIATCIDTIKRPVRYLETVLAKANGPGLHGRRGQARGRRIGLPV